MLLFVLILVQYWMPMLLLVVAGLFAGFAVNRNPKTPLDGRPVAQHANLVAFLLTTTSFFVALGFRITHASPSLLGRMPYVAIGSATAAAILLAASLGSLLRRRIAREAPPARWTRLDAAAGTLALMTPVAFGIIIVGAMSTPTGYREALALSGALPPAFAITAIYLSMATRVDRPREKVRRRDVVIAIVGAVFVAWTSVLAFVQAASHGVVAQPLLPLLAGVTIVVIAIDELRKRRRMARTRT